LYDAGWDPNGNWKSARSERPRTDEGLEYPSSGEVKEAFRAEGLELQVRHVSLFNCYRAEWKCPRSGRQGYCVGATEAEALVFALAQLVESTSDVGEAAGV
jgi:hypothetical protein